MKLRFKIVCVLFAALSFTWLLPPNIILDEVVARAYSQSSQASLEQLADDDTARAAAKNPDVEMLPDDYDLDTSDIVGEIVEGREIRQTIPPCRRREPGRGV